MKNLLKKILCFMLLTSSFVLAVGCTNKLSKIEVVNLEVFENLEYGGTLNWNKLQLKCTYSDGKILTYAYSDIKDKLNIELGDFSSIKAGTYNIGLTYEGKSCVIDVEVLSPAISGIGIDRSKLAEVINIENVTTEYKNAFQNKIIVSVFKTDGTSSILPATDYQIKNYDMSNNQISTTLDLGCLNFVGDHWFAVTYGSFTPKLFMVRVKLGDENGFILGLDEIKREISVGEEVDFTKIKVYATYSDGRKIELNSNEYQIDYSKFDNNTAGEYEIIVSYKSYNNKSFVIQVKD